MKRLRLFTLTLGMALGIAAAFAAQPSEAELIKQAKVTKAQAQEIALAKVPHGTVTSAEIENEKGHLVWSFDITKPHTKNITESVQVRKLVGPKPGTAEKALYQSHMIAETG